MTKKSLAASVGFARSPSFLLLLLAFFLLLVLSSPVFAETAECVGEKLISVQTCSGKGELYLYKGNDPFQSIGTSFVVNRGQLFIFTRADYISSASLSVKVDGTPVSLAAVVNKTSPFKVKVYRADTYPGALVEISGSSTRGARAIQGYLAQDEANPAYDLNNVNIVYDNLLSNTLFLAPGNYEYVVFDKYSIDQPGQGTDYRKLNVKIIGGSGTITDENYIQPYPAGVQGAVVDEYSISEAGNYTLAVDTKDSVYWFLLDCKAPVCGNGTLESGEECDDGNLENGDGCSAECEIEECTPRTIGYWKQPCKHHYAHESRSAMLSYLAKIHSATNLFDSVTDFDGMCGILDPSEPATMKQRAKQQIMALWLNVVSEKIFLETTVNLEPLSNSGNVGNALSEAEGLIDVNAEKAKTIADEINNGFVIDECHPVERCGNGKLEEGEECEPPNTDFCDSECKWKEMDCVEAKEAGYLTGSITGGTASVANNTPFDYNAGLAVYEKFDEVIDHQKIYDFDTGIVNGNDSLGLGVELPDCKYQIDLFCGPVLMSLDGQRYGERLIDSEHAGGTHYCGPRCGNGKLEAGEECDDGNLQNGDGCSADCRIEPMRIIAFKIVCDDESDLPNWGLGGPDINSGTAQDFVDSHPDCRFERDWFFQWAYSSTTNPGNQVGKAGEGWTEFGPTDAGGKAVVEIKKLNSANKIWVREEFKEGYIPFTYGGNNSNDVSAEMYCHEDVLNYDNYDYIYGPLLGKTYYCIAWNAPEWECTENEDCSHLNEDYCSGSMEVHKRGICVARKCEVSTKEKECNDGLYCNGIETCNSGAVACQAGTLVDCSSLDDQCNEGECSEEQDKCVKEPVENETYCNDGLYCNGGDHCYFGQCISNGPMVDCNYMNDQCNKGACNEETDQCIKEPVQNGTACDDGLYCNEGEVCLGGVCSNGGAKDCSGFDIFGIGTCFWSPDDLNFTWDYRPPFTSTCDEQEDKCMEGNWAITHTLDKKCVECLENADCDDGLYCNGQEVCNQDTHSCELAREIDCSYLNDQCNLGECDEGTDQCKSEPVENNTPCDDGLYCNEGEVCIDGACSNGSAKDCGIFDIFGIATCDWDPDDVWWTWDYRPEFNSTCDEQANKCTEGDWTITHNPDERCAECIVDADCQPTGNHCTESKCVNYECVENPKPYSTACENGLYCDGIDHCDGLGECVPMAAPVDCSNLDDQCNEGECDESLDECVKKPVSDFMPCNDGLFCNSGEVCMQGTCTNGSAMDCGTFDLPPVGQCNYFIDGFDWTWDFFAGFTSTCDEENDLCTTGTEDVDSDCSMQCGSECEADGNCVAHLEGDECYFSGACSLYSECACGFEHEYCPEPGSIIDGYCYWGEAACTENGCDLNKTKMNCYKECDPLEGPKGLPEIHTVKSVGTPKIECNYLGDQNEAEECWFVNTGTEFVLEADYNGPNQVSTIYRIRVKENFDCNIDEWGAWGKWNGYQGPFTIPGDSIHEMEYFSADEICQIEEEHHLEIDIVDSQPPVPSKTVGVPKEAWDGLSAVFYDLEEFCSEPGNCWKVTLQTPIALDCTDPQPHPVGNESACFFVELDADDATENYCGEYGGSYNANGDGYCCMQKTVEEFFFLEESEHNLKYYCIDALGNKGQIDDEKFKVGGKGFEIILNKKWNLISVPFALLDSDAESVFSGISEKVHAVWAFDSETGQWLVYNPDMPGASNLEEILPGWGYWVSCSDDNVSWVVGGSLFNTGPIAPPSKIIAPGWNLIGYYATEWQENEICTVCGKEKECWTGPVFCSLGSLLNTQGGGPKWSGLWAFKNCGEHDTEWVALDVCGENNKMRAGEGYWIELGEEEIYAPATTCIWNSELQCMGS